MRYDLELNIVGELTQSGLKSISNTFYGTDTSVITPAKWDVRTLVTTSLINKGAIDTSRYRGGVDIPPAAYSSGIDTNVPTTLELYKYLIRDNIICPLFNGGYVYVHNYRYAWSNNVTVKQFESDIAADRYYCDIEADVDVTTINVETLELKFPGYMTYNKRWTYVPLISIKNGNGSFNLESSLRVTYDSSPLDNKFTVVPTYDGNKKVIKNTVYLNGGIIKYKDLSYGIVDKQSVGVFGIKEFPLKDLTVKAIRPNGMPLDSYTDYRYFTSVIRAKNITDEELTLSASWTVTPVMSYAQTERSTNLDVVYKNLNILPNSISFKDGLVCLFNLYGAPGGTILTDDGTNILYPFYISLTADKDQLEIYDTVRLKAKLTSANAIPVKGAKLTFSLDGDMSKFVESNGDSYVARTGIDGMAEASVIVAPSKFGWYVQKEWVSGNTITLPFDIEHYDPNEIYVYFITNDDPVLGKAFAEYGDGGDPKGQFSFYDVLNRAETPIEEVYNRGKSFDSYQISGRKIAYVKLQRDQGSSKLYSSFIKPTTVTPGVTSTIQFRNLFIRNTFEPVISDKNMPISATILKNAADNSPFVVDKPITITGHRPGSLPQRPGLSLSATGEYVEYLSTFKASVENCTVITFAEDIPMSDRVAGMWLITGSSGYLIANVAFDDTANDLHIAPKEPIKIPILNFIKSEYEFILSDVDLAGQNTAFGAFSYFTVSEYLNNPFGLNACTYACIYSDAIGKRCTNKKIPGDKYYLLDSQGISCVHTPEYDEIRPNWDSSLAAEPSPDFKCPGLDARFVNPFVLFQSEKTSPKQGWFDVTSPDYWVTRYYQDGFYTKWGNGKWYSLNSERLVIDSKDLNFFGNYSPTKIRITVDGGVNNVLTLTCSDFSGAVPVATVLDYKSGDEITLSAGQLETIDLNSTTDAKEPFSITRIEIYIP